MHKLLISLAATASLTVGGCGLMPGNSVGDGIVHALDQLPLIYRPTIQQGNVVTQEVVNRLEPGMSKRQVRYALGTPMLVDVFHQDRWDFVYTKGVGSTPDEIKRVTLYFEDDRLTRIEGDYRPQPLAERAEEKKEVVISVPDWEGSEETLWGRAIKSVGIGD